MTHAEFEAEPVHAVRWMLEIDHLYAEARNSKKPPTEGPGGLM
jgi:hypothetical protein